MLRCYYSSAEYLPVTYSSSPTLLQSEWANRQVRSSHVKIPGPSSQGEREGAAPRAIWRMYHYAATGEGILRASIHPSACERVNPLHVTQQELCTHS